MEVRKNEIKNIKTNTIDINIIDHDDEYSIQGIIKYPVRIKKRKKEYEKDLHAKSLCLILKEQL